MVFLHLICYQITLAYVWIFCPSLYNPLSGIPTTVKFQRKTWWEDSSHLKFFFLLAVQFSSRRGNLTLEEFKDSVSLLLLSWRCFSEFRKGICTQLWFTLFHTTWGRFCTIHLQPLTQPSRRWYRVCLHYCYLGTQLRLDDFRRCYKSPAWKWPWNLWFQEALPSYVKQQVGRKEKPTEEGDRLYQSASLEIWWMGYGSS